MIRIFKTTIRYSMLAAFIMACASTAALADSAPIKIGVLTPLSGTYEPIGQQVVWGTKLAVQEINAQGGIEGRPIKLVLEDGQANTGVATRQAEKLFQRDDVDFLVGIVSSGATLAVGQVAERNNKLMATSVSLSDAITGSKCSPNVFRVDAAANMQSTALAAWLKGTKPDARVFLLGPDYEMGRSTVASFERAANDIDLKIVGTPLFPPLGEKDYTPFFGQIRQARPNVIYTSTAGNDSVRLFSQLQQYGLLQRIQMIGASVAVTAQNVKAMGDAAEGFVTVADYTSAIDTPANHAFIKAFKKAFNTEPDMYGADSYGLIYLYKAAVEKAKSTKTDAVREAMEGLSWETPQGTKTMRAEDHQAQMNMYALKFHGSDFEMIEKIPAAKAATPDHCERF